MTKLPWIVLAILLTCCIRPHYERQDVDIPCEWRLEADEGSTLCNYHWWEQFQDPVLNRYISTALRNNQDLKEAISRVFEFYAQLGITGSDLYPTIEGEASYFRIQTSNALPFSFSTTDLNPVPPTQGVDRINDDFFAAFNLSWELDFWGRLFSAREAAYFEWLGQIEARRALVIVLVSSVANAYITLRLLDTQLEIAQKTYDSRWESLKLAQTRFEVGETSELEVVQAAVELEIAAISVLQLERDIPQQENRLSILLGENPHEIERGLSIKAFQLPAVIPAGLPSDLLTRRPDIVEAEDQLIATNARVTEARAFFFPRITLTGLYGSESSELGHFLTSPAEIWQYGISVLQTIFDAGRNVYRVDKAKAIRNEALFNYRQTILTAFAEVNDALVAYQMNQKLALEHQRQVKILNQYLHLATLRYQEGEIDYLNVLDAQRRLFEGELALAQAQADSFTAVVQLYRALGGGWVMEADSAAISSICQF
jgi:multidrug efflux system outer membrane protein